MRNIGQNSEEKNDLAYEHGIDLESEKKRRGAGLIVNRPYLKYIQKTFRMSLKTPIQKRISIVEQNPVIFDALE